MKLAISNIAWTSENDEHVYQLMKQYGFTGLEIAPTRIIETHPYDHLQKAELWSRSLKKTHGISIPSMQSIWYGRQERLFGTKEEQEILVNYTKRAVDFAAAIGCENLVFGCPKNRVLPEGVAESVALVLFNQLGEYAKQKGTNISIEANPPIYNTNYVNDTAAAIRLVEEVRSEGFKLNFDFGTVIENKETIHLLAGKSSLINHVHISEPYLKPILKREIHRELAGYLKDNNYKRFVSIEMAGTDDMSLIEETMNYVREVFG